MKLKDDFFDSGAILGIRGEKCLLGWGKRTWLKEPDPKKEFSFYFPDFFLTSKTPWFTHEYMAEVDLAEIEVDVEEPRSYDWVSSDRGLFAETFEKLQKSFQEKKLKKAVPFLFEECDGAINLKNTVNSLLNYARKQPVHVYGFWGEGEGMIGASPEVLFQFDQSSLQTVACAGTTPIDQSKKLFRDQKLINEHEWVVEGIEESLTSYGKVIRGDAEILKLTKLAHLVTPITIALDKEAPFTEIVKDLHPTPALGAFPREEGMRWLKEFQTKIDRKRFGAPVGYCSQQGRGACVVAIRNIQWKDGKTQIGAGCGIVEESQLEEEWDEIKLKISLIKEILAL